MIPSFAQLGQVSHPRNISCLGLNVLDVPQELDLLSTMLDRADQINFDSKEEYVQAITKV